eukprot:TRINITY_DN15278_c0_g1_i4.p1 TRINITY_DN15278_c0_g1~~TRINITY_DN15278_c0_g1_i4.p1  ORF type:complete len:130 (-),score=25.09 TRINITY_DN15278_c0_g1_i4:446-835(-)
MFFFFFQAEDGIRDAQESRGLGDVYKRQTIKDRFDERVDTRFMTMAYTLQIVHVLTLWTQEGIYENFTAWLQRPASGKDLARCPSELPRAHSRATAESDVTIPSDQPQVTTRTLDQEQSDDSEDLAMFL